MLRAIDQFERNIKSIKEISAIYSHLKYDLNLPGDYTDILRSQVVYVISALDKLVHELVKIGMLQTFSGKRPKTTKFNNFSISIEAFNNILHNQQFGGKSTNFQSPEFFFEQEIINKHKTLAFQAPDKISEALSYIWTEEHKWRQIAIVFNAPEDDIKKRLKSIVSRRNQIVHEADVLLNTDCRNKIDENDVNELIDFILKLGKSIYQCCR